MSERAVVMPHAVNIAIRTTSSAKKKGASGQRRLTRNRTFAPGVSNTSERMVASRWRQVDGGGEWTAASDTGECMAASEWGELMAAS